MLTAHSATGPRERPLEPPSAFSSNMHTSLKIELLADHPEAIPRLRALFEREWAPYYGPDGPSDAERDLRESCRKRELLVALVAIFEGTVCGTVSLKRASVTTHPHLTPWLAALLVAPEYRRRGIGDRLIAAVGETARRLGYDCLYTGTDTAESLVVRRGWAFLDRTPYFVTDVSVYRKAV